MLAHRGVTSSVLSGKRKREKENSKSMDIVQDDKELNEHNFFGGGGEKKKRKACYNTVSM